MVVEGRLTMKEMDILRMTVVLVALPTDFETKTPKTHI